ncbi:tRNA lysidine(34) synthetase TilS [Ornithinimicrobium sp. W1679]|uniref:tRNA lysidine(34) synthetase TilS n=1 Tax=Ornithinimicrobium sp. W1679 TaxID=3418770 RepID=UPI003CF52971
MPGPHPAVAATRVAVRRTLGGLPPSGPVLVACSGGADSLALAAATAFEAPRAGVSAGAVVVDHGLQEGSDRVAATAASACRGLGLDPVEVVRVEVDAPGGPGTGPEGAARRSRYAALLAAARRSEAVAVLVGHTRDDQAEQVLLGLARGSGARSLAGMPAGRPLGDGSPVLLLRPFLGVGRAQTAQACAAAGLEPWTDPHNDDPRFARVRARRALGLLEDELGPGLVAGLARSADLLRDDADALERVSASAYQDLGPPPWKVGALRALAPAVRRRLWRRVALAEGSPGTDLTGEHLRAVDALLTDWHGQGPVHLPGGVRARREGGLLHLGRP